MVERGSLGNEERWGEVVNLEGNHGGLRVSESSETVKNEGK